MMAVRLLFPTFVFERYLLDPNLNERQGIDEKYLKMCKDEIDAMRKKDPVGRNVSNRSGWQSDDGVESNPGLSKLMRRIEQTFMDEVLPFHGVDTTKCTIHIGNSWANINDKGSWNTPHLHNGCWYSGVFYVKADGDEGQIVMIDKDPKVVSDFPNSQRAKEHFQYEPREGNLILFPSALMHMVAPNTTDKERYSISFNMNMQYHNPTYRHGNVQNYNPNEFVFDIDDNGDPIVSL